MTDLTIQQGDSFAFEGTLTDGSGAIIALAGKKITIDLIRKGCIALRLTTAGGGLLVEDDHILGYVASETTASLCGEYRIYAKIEENGSQVSSSDYGVLTINPNKTGTTKWN